MTNEKWALGGDLPVNRIGFGAMRLADTRLSPGPARDVAIAVLRRAIELGVNHIDTSDFYGPYVVNELIRETLAPYPEDLVIVTKVGAFPDGNGGLVKALAPDDLRKAVHDNLGRLGVDRLDLVNLRVGQPLMADDAPIEKEFEVLAELREQGLIRHLGVSNVTARQFESARAIAPVAQVQNRYSVVERGDEDLVDRCAEAGVAYVPFFPLGGGISPLAGQILGEVAAKHSASELASSPSSTGSVRGAAERQRGRAVSEHQIALAWLLARSPAILLIPGTSSVVHLEQNMAVGELVLTGDDLAQLDRIRTENQPIR